MRFLRMHLTLMSLLLMPLLTQAADTKPADAIRQAEDKWIAGVKANDRAALEKILSKDLVYTHSTGKVEDRTQYIASMTSGEQKYASVDYTDIAVRVYGTTAVVTAQARMTGSTKSVPFDNKLRVLHVWVKQGGSWVLVAHQTTKLPL